MAKSYDNPSPTGPKKSAPGKASEPTNPRLAEAQRRAQAIAKRPSVSPTQFFEEAWTELKKTTWPNREVLTKSTTVVLALVLAVAVWVGGLDAVLGTLVDKSHIFSAR